MDMILAFLPFIVYMVLAHSIGITEALTAAAVTALAMQARELGRGKPLKVLEIGTVLLFGGLALYAWLTGTRWGIADVRLRVDGGLALVVLASLLLKKPFTLQYARERVEPARWDEPAFIRSNYVITGVWFAAFLLMLACDAVMAYDPSIPTRIPVWVTIGAMWLAIKFTRWYPAHLRRQGEPQG